MKILQIRPVPKGTGKTIARFDLEINDGLRIYGLVLRGHPDGGRTIAGPQCDGRRFATFLPDIAAQITTIASAAYDEGKHAGYRSTY